MKGDEKEGLDLTMISYFPRGLSAHVIRVFNIKEVIHGESWCPLLKMKVVLAWLIYFMQPGDQAEPTRGVPQHADGWRHGNVRRGAVRTEKEKARWTV